MTRTLDYSAVAERGQLAPVKQGGFTLLEIILVMAIIAAASILIVPNLSGLEARTFSTQVRQAHTLLNFARRTAVVSGQPSTVIFNVIPLEEIELASESSLSNVVAQWNGVNVNVRFRDSTDREIEIEESTQVTFYPEGGSSGGMLLFAQADQSGIIDIDPFSGRVSSRDPEGEL